MGLDARFRAGNFSITIIRMKRFIPLREFKRRFFSLSGIEMEWGTIPRPHSQQELLNLHVTIFSYTSCWCFESRSDKYIYYTCSGLRRVCVVGTKFIMVRTECPYFQSL